MVIPHGPSVFVTKNRLLVNLLTNNPCLTHTHALDVALSWKKQGSLIYNLPQYAHFIRHIHDFTSMERVKINLVENAIIKCGNEIV